MITIDTNPEKLLEYRAAKDREVFMNYEDTELYFYCNTGEGFILRAHVVSPKKYKDIFKYMNQAAQPENLMIETHNFADSSTWQDGTTTQFELKPFEGYKLNITSIITRFPENIALTNTPLNFVINKYYEPLGAVVPVVTKTYSSIQELLNQSNSPWYTVRFTSANAFKESMIEVKFRYADDDTNNWSKLNLSGNLQESIVSTIGGDGILKNTAGEPLEDPCYAIYNCKRVLDF